MKTITEISNIANELQTALTAELLELSKVPAVDFDKYGISQDLLDSISESVEPISNESLTTTEVGGSGTFDILMKTVSNHLLEEFEAGRISGAEYTRAYIELTGTAMASSIEFLLNRDQARWAAITAQIQASDALVNQDIALQQLDINRVQSEMVRVNYANEKAKLATVTEQLTLMEEQVEAARGQTLTTRRDGQPIVGVIGSQIDLQQQQKITFQKDMELKTAKVFSDAWTVLKSIDEGLTPPESFSNDNVDRILSTIA